MHRDSWPCIGDSDEDHPLENEMQKMQKFTTSSPMLICCLFDRSHSVKSEEISHYCLICISLIFRDFEHLFTHLLEICVFGGKMSI